MEPDEEGFHAYAPALPGCYAVRATIDEARANIAEAKSTLKARNRTGNLSLFKGSPQSSPVYRCQGFGVFLTPPCQAIRKGAT
jgi:hypothetical protein